MRLHRSYRSILQPWRTGLAEHFPAHAVCQWFGNSQAVAREDYLQVTDEHSEKAAHFQSRQAPVSLRIESHNGEAKHENPEKVAVSRGIVFNQVGPAGLEPATKGL